jgi:hypothetical protein
LYGFIIEASGFITAYEKKIGFYDKTIEAYPFGIGARAKIIEINLFRISCLSIVGSVHWFCGCRLPCRAAAQTTDLTHRLLRRNLNSRFVWTERAAAHNASLPSSLCRMTKRGVKVSYGMTMME